MDDEYAFDDTKSAKFNAGVLQTQRINKILDLLNSAKMNPEVYNVDYLDYNFNIVLNCISNLYDELDGYLLPKEKKDSIEMRERIDALIEQYPLLEDRRDINGESKRMFVRNNWKYIKKAMGYYERFVKQLGIKYQVIAATIDTNIDGL